MQANSGVREAAKQVGVKNWEIADEIGVSEATFGRWLRKELTDDKKKRVLAAIVLISDRKRGKI